MPSPPRESISAYCHPPLSLTSFPDNTHRVTRREASDVPMSLSRVLSLVLFTLHCDNISSLGVNSALMSRLETPVTAHPQSLACHV